MRCKLIEILLTDSKSFEFELKNTDIDYSGFETNTFVCLCLLGNGITEVLPVIMQGQIQYLGEEGVVCHSRREHMSCTLEPCKKVTSKRERRVGWKDLR